MVDLIYERQSEELEAHIQLAELMYANKSLVPTTLNRFF